MLSIRWRWLIFFSEIFLSPPYALHSLQVAMILLNFGNFSKCRKSRFSQSLLFHSIPLPYVVNQIFPLYFVMGSFPPATAPNFQNFSKSYVLHLLTVANFFFKNFSKSPYALHSLQVAMDGRIFRYFSKSPMFSIRCRWLLFHNSKFF